MAQKSSSKQTPATSARTRSSVRQTVAAASSKKRAASPSLPQQPAAKKGKGSTPASANRLTQKPKVTPKVSSKASTRRPPANINSDVEDLSTDHHIPPRHHGAVSEDEDHDERLGDEDPDADSEEIENEDDSLDLLDPMTLKKALLAERAHWAAQVESEDDDDEYMVPKAIDSGNGEDLADNPELDLDNDDDVDEEIGIKPVKASKRARARRDEVPVWNSAEPEPIISDDESAATSSPHPPPMVADVNDAWPDEAHYVPPLPGARTIRINSQPPPLSTLIKAAIRQVIGDALFVDAYPSVSTIDNYFLQVLTDIGAHLEFPILVDRISVDRVLFSHIGRILSTRLSNIRCLAKRATLPKVETAYLLTGTSDERKKKIEKLIETGDYIYPRNLAGMLRRTQPFHHPVIVSSVREYYFTGTRMSFANRYMSRFTSSIETGPQALEREVPLPMVCMIATAVHAAISDWNTGYLKKSEFNADEFEDVYRGHELFLKNIQNERPGAYHRLMADLYKEVSNTHGVQSAAAIANTSMAILDLAGMPE
ncbi:hypothetical protein H0H81_005120 [Sphagnurus paluster]|uniref:DUF6532 domain-containing protein n=1 Tax=Sphagnurus paluster TaxID=117069 RepID=A0A9P7KP95_9AGAR|nr:hypothetical protein H0H81_005120 [Sphagnurus paluster]